MTDYVTDKMVEGNKKQETPSVPLDEIVSCPFCGEELKMFKTSRSNYAVAHICESGLRVEIFHRNRKEICEILSKRAS